MQSNIRFANYNKEYWAKEFGEEILQNGRFNRKATSAIKKWMVQTVKDHKDYGFNTIPYHRQLNIPDEYFEELFTFLQYSFCSVVNEILLSLINAGFKSFTMQSDTSFILFKYCSCSVVNKILFSLISTGFKSVTKHCSNSTIEDIVSSFFLETNVF